MTPGMEGSIGDYLAALGSRAATPGGGAAAGLSGAQAAALMAMVCNLTKTDEVEITKIRALADDAVTRFEALIEDDIKGFDAVMAAYRLPKGTRADALQAALANATEAPLGMMAQSRDLVPHLARLVAIGNPNLITDVGTAATLLVATLDAAHLNVLVNVKAITDAKVKQAILANASVNDMAKAKAELNAVLQQTIAMISA